MTGLRVDHPDGLVDPADYLERLRALAPDAWITVEKILEPGEELPPWPVEGTTGYDAMREVNGVFVDHAAEPYFTDLYRRLTGDERSITDHIEAGKRMVDDELLPAEVQPDGPARARGARTPGRRSPRSPIAFDVYRSYLPAGAEHLDAALALAAQRRPALAATLDALSPRLHDPDDELARRMQQLSGATMAKGVEDTAYYRYARFVALNEVGGEPRRVRDPAGATFHELQAQRQAGPAAVDDGPQHPRHQARRGRPGPAGGAGGGSGGVDPVRRAGAGGEHRAQPGLRLPHRADPGRCGPDRGRADARVRREGHARGRRTAPPGPHPTRRTRRRCTPWSTPRTTAP